MSSRVYVGNLPPDCREREVEDLFYKVSLDHGGIYWYVLNVHECRDE